MNSYYVSLLHWDTPLYLQLEAIEWLAEHVRGEQLCELFNITGKMEWSNVVRIVQRIGYPDNEAALPKLVELFQDMNWPGAIEALRYLQTLDKSIVLPYIEAGAEEARRTNDDSWLWFLYSACTDLHICRDHFVDGTLFDLMQHYYDHD